MSRIKIEYIPIDRAIPYEKNPRDNSKAIDKVAKSIEAYGFKVPIVIDSNNVIVCGHTRVMAAKQLGMCEVPAVVADDLTPEQIKAFRIADNKVEDYSIFDNKLLLEELESIGNTLFTGFETSEIFNDLLDVDDNSVVEQNKNGVQYTINFKTQNKGKMDKVQKFIEGLIEI